MLDFSSSERIEAKSESEAMFYAKYLNIDPKGIDYFLYFQREPLDEKNRLINKYLAEKYSEKELKFRVKQMIKTYESEKICNQDWFWLSAVDERAINWAWGYIQLNKDKEIYSRKLKIETAINKLNLNKLDPDTATTLARRNCLIESFQETNAQIEERKIIAKDLLREWEYILNKKGLESLIDRYNEKQCEWALSYLKEIRTTNHSRRLFKSINNKEKYFSAIALFDLINDDRDKELILMKMRKAWTQYKYRSKQNGKKSYSISMSKTTKSKLDKIVEHTNSKICDTIERLINDEYERLN
ncbi:hypothetical protein C942_00317 [Photobacterium marinum]|uniref:Uncharacterized protein n=1 Tax=Photobacterium marinum TaxID=1056511 RepID=L8JBE0_9GAMM|nr:hypothetical protein [Photobacterium marinum]ELR66131.1 hypothetical protein C942_00317 [Photobacterium marinum]